MPAYGGLNDIDINEQLEKVKQNLPPGIEIPDQFKNMTVPSMEQMLKMIKDKCKKASGNDDAYTQVEEAQSKLMECLSGLINVDELQNDIKEAQPKGELDTVFNG